MVNKDEIEAVARATTEIMKAVPVYQDAVQPVAQELGKSLKTLGGVINIALAPLAAMVYGYEVIKVQLKERLEKKLIDVRPENIVTPKLQVVGPLLEKYKYIHDSRELSDMFVNLLANAMNKDQIQKAHPSFVNIISELSPDEAKLIKILATEEVIPKIDVRVKFNTPENPGHLHILINYTHLGLKASLQYNDLTPSYLSNLERLNIISCPVGDFHESYTHKDYYKPLENDPLIIALKEKYKETGEIEVKQGIIRITDFGKMFMGAVL